MNNVKEAEKYVLYLLKQRYKYKNQIKYFGIKRSNNHPVIYHTAYNDKQKKINIHFYKNNKISILVKDSLLYEEKIFQFNSNLKNIAKIKEMLSKIYTFFPLYDYDYFSIIIDKKEKFKEFKQRTKDKNNLSLYNASFNSKIYLFKYLIKEVLYKKSINSLYIENGSKEDLIIHIRNDYIKSYGAIKISNNIINIYLKKYNEMNYQQKDLIYSIDLNNYVVLGELKEPFLEKELKNMKKKLKIYF